MISPFLVLAVGTLASEDLTCIAAGVLIAQGVLGFSEGVAACFTGIVTGDLVLFMAGTLLGQRALRSPLLRRVMPAHKVDEAAKWLEGRGLTAVLLSRFTPGLRMATYFAAGSLRMRFWSFASYFVAVSLLWTPLLIGSTVLFGDRLLKSIFVNQTHTLLAFLAVFAVGAGNLLLSRGLSTVEGRERLSGIIKRMIRRPQQNQPESMEKLAESLAAS